jgi:hypothetical protein
VHGREEQAHGATLGDTEDRDSLGSDSFEHRLEVRHPLFQRRHGGDGIRQTDAALVPKDEPGEHRQPGENLLPGRVLPEPLDVRDKTRDEDKIDRPLSDHLVGDVEVAIAGVPGFGLQGCPT